MLGCEKWVISGGEKRTAENEAFLLPSTASSIFAFYYCFDSIFIHRKYWKKISTRKRTRKRWQQETTSMPLFRLNARFGWIKINPVLVFRITANWCIQPCNHKDIVGIHILIQGITTKAVWERYTGEIKVLVLSVSDDTWGCQCLPVFPTDDISVQREVLHQGATPSFSVQWYSF